MLEANTKVVLDESRNTKVVLDESRNSDYAKARNKGKPTQELDTVIEAWTQDYRSNAPYNSHYSENTNEKARDLSGASLEMNEQRKNLFSEDSKKGYGSVEDTHTDL